MYDVSDYFMNVSIDSDNDGKEDLFMNIAAEPGKEGFVNLDSYVFLYWDAIWGI
jgi:hypothetical protein